MANIDKVSVKNTVYNIVSPAVVSDYIEVIGGACTKPDGYVEDEVILAKQNDVQLLFKATQDIAFGANIVENTNCVRTTLEEVLKNAGGGGGASSADQVSYDNSDTGLEAENVQEAVDELATNAGTASSQIQTLTQQANALTQQANAMVNVYGSKNILQNNLVSMSQDGVNFVVNEDKSITIDTNGQTVSVEQNGVAICHFVSEFSGDFILSYGNATLPSELRLMMEDATVHEWAIAPQTVSMVKGHTYWVWIIYNAGLNIAQASAKTIFPMLRDARIINGYYEPYSMTNQQLTPIAQAVSNRNLLDNPWFTVNQRGASSYSTNGGYTVDRWRNWSTEGEVITVNSDNSLTLTKSATDKTFNITQVIEESVGELLVGKTVTLSAMLGDGTVKSVSGIVEKSNSFVIRISIDDTTKASLDFYRYSDVWNARIISWAGGTSAPGSITIKAIKLELGSVSTLAMDTAPNYAEELLKCQRYFNRVKQNATISQIGIALPANTDVLRFIYQFPVEMRTIPIVSASANTDFYYSTNGDTTAMTDNPTSVTRQGGTTRDVGIGFTKTGAFTLGTPYVVAGKGYFDLSADL